MIHLENAMEIFKILPRTNCRDCRVPTCLAFAAAVFKGEKKLENCPHLEKDVLRMFNVQNAQSRTLEREEERALKQLKREVANVDHASAAERLGAGFSGGMLTIKCLGKDFRVDSQGNVISDVHVHGWITVPILTYVLSCSGKPASGNWVPFRELKNGASWAPLFGRRCETPLKQVADTHTDLFEHMIQVFNAKPAPNAFDSDIAVVLHPLPRLPMLICYWKPDGSMESSLNVFFDDTAEENLVIDSIYRITAGLVIMFEKIAITHDL
ncbi:MAG: DUF3786 domain-containing protein [Desulfomonilaceae bacterium]|nr:DUF3786 domain-containing protein [Desulfomonilaceae bacterium]